uniref:Uncharacterized protein n=1 Tax=Triticum urartu TaxID=4572 RepID=A0A8R7Q8G6_TRIUA
MSFAASCDSVLKSTQLPRGPLISLYTSSSTIHSSATFRLVISW